MVSKCFRHFSLDDDDEEMDDCSIGMLQLIYMYSVLKTLNHLFGDGEG